MQGRFDGKEQGGDDGESGGGNQEAQRRERTKDEGENHDELRGGAFVRPARLRHIPRDHDRARSRQRHRQHPGVARLGQQAGEVSAQNNDGEGADAREQRLVTALRVLPLDADQQAHQQGHGALPGNLRVSGHQQETSSIVMRSLASQPA